MNEINNEKIFQQGSLFDGPSNFYLFFDTETTGLPRNYNASFEDLDNWPRVVQLAWVLVDENKKVIEEKNFIIKPDGFSIPEASAAIHGITDAKANEFGVSIFEVLNDFNKALQNNNLTLVAHNINFDINVMGAEFLRADTKTNFMELPQICTMKSSINFCNLPNKKFPKLIELYRQLFHDDFFGAHDALADVLACSRCFFEMKNRGII